MFVVKGVGQVICTTCNVAAKTKKRYLEDLYADDPEYFFEPFDHEDNYLYVCPKCKNQDFPSE